jgi:sterol desaturase/sphingolipid hydroxylase (fatty acid hydroxylase superfamily)
MPTPLEILLDPISLVILVMYAALMLWEAIRPGRKLPVVKGWRLRGLTAFAAFFYLSTYLPLLWTEQLAQYQLFDLTSLGTVGGAVVGFLLYELGVYVWHRTMHRFQPLWRAFHQMHHSAERLDTYGAFYFSPLDMVGWTVLGSLCLTLIIGVNPQAATIVLLATTCMSIFQHANIRTPRWLGYFVQRPESHTIHHGRGVHAYNYSDLPLFDILFGTFRNPKGFETETGFYHGASRRVGEMLVWRDVTRKPGERGLVEATA